MVLGILITIAFVGYNQLQPSPPAPSEGGAIETQTFPRERWENLPEIFILDEAETLNSCSVFVFRIRYVGPEFANLQLFWDSQTILIEQLDSGQKFTVELASDYVRSESTFDYVRFEVEFCLCEPTSSDCRVIEGTLEFYLEKFGDTLQPLTFPPGETYAALSYLEREAVVAEVVRRLRGEGYFEKVVGFGYTEKGFEVLFEDEADPRVLTIIREVTGDLPLDILENAEVIIDRLAEFSEAVRKITSDSISLEIESYVSGKKLMIDRNDPEFEEILQFLSDASAVRVVSKTQLVDNQAVEVTIPYPYGIFLTFRSKDEAEVWFNSVSSGELWFESDEAIYNVSVNPSLNDVLNQLLSGASAAPQPPQSTVPIATIIIIIVMVAVVVAALGFLAIRKIEKP